MAAKRSARTPKTAYRCLRGFSYPASKSDRDRIHDAMRGNPAMTDAQAASLRAEVGNWQRYEAGDRIENLPTDVSANLLKRGALEVITGKSAGTAKGEEVTADDTQS